MKYFILLALCLFSLSACTSLELQDSVTYTRPDGSSVVVSRTTKASGKNDGTNPITTELPNMSVEPVLLADGTVSWMVQNGGGSASGAFSSIKQAALQLLKWPIIIAAVVFMIGIAMLFLPSIKLKKLGAGIACAGMILMGVAYGMGSYPYIALIILIVAILLALGGVGYCLYYIRIQNKANTELVSNIEYMKEEVLDPEDKNKLFLSSKPLIKLSQSKTTQQVVDETRRELGYKSNST